MKRVLIVIGILLLVVAGYLYFSRSAPESEQPKTEVETKVETKKTVPKPALDLDDFYFTADDTGLVLKKMSDPDFEKVLTTRPVKSAELAGGILTFTEIVSGGEQMKAINLEAYAEFLRSGK